MSTSPRCLPHGTVQAMLAVLCSHFSFEWPKGQEPVVPKAAITMKVRSCCMV